MYDFIHPLYSDIVETTCYLDDDKLIIGKYRFEDELNQEDNLDYFFDFDMTVSESFF